MGGHMAPYGILPFRESRFRGALKLWQKVHSMWPSDPLALGTVLAVMFSAFSVMGTLTNFASKESKIHTYTQSGTPFGNFGKWSLIGYRYRFYVSHYLQIENGLPWWICIEAEGKMVHFTNQELAMVQTQE